MKLKKNPKADLSKDSSLYFAIGLTIVLFFTWQSIEWKTYEKSAIDYQTLNVDEDVIEEILIVLPIVVPPPPPPPPVIINVVNDIVDTPEDPIPTSEVEPNEIIDVNNIPVVDDFIEDEVLIDFVDEAPVFPGCEVVSKSEQKKCFQKMIFIHINKTVCYPEIGQEMGIQGKVYMRFVIEKDGSITNIEVLRSPDRNLEKEALRIINKLPKMTPGKQRGRPVRVPFSIPIAFKLN